jgi:GTPase SAR1 family protein
LGALIVFDITNKKTFESVMSYWMNALKDRAAENVQIILIGNKIDKNNDRAVSQDEAEKYAKKLNISYR